MNALFSHILFNPKARKWAVTGMLMLTAIAPVLAKGATGPKPESSLSNPLAITLILIVAVLALVIAMLAYVVLGAADLHRTKNKAGQTLATLLFLMIGFQSYAQDAGATNEAVETTIGGLDKLAFYALVGVIFVEVVVVLYLLYNLQLLIRKEKVKVAEEAGIDLATGMPVKPRLNWWEKFNSFRPVEEEVDIDLGHNYDGIRELDNRLPPWWLYGFYGCILFAGIYLWRFHVSHSAPSQKEEYDYAMRIADEQKENYLKKSANKIDENSVTLLAAADIEKGKNLFITSCAACHGKLGEGGVGPNLTDDYWIHGGGLKDIFKTIKYGYPEKGMMAWKETLNPMQMAQITSFIKSIRGTNPPNGKEKQGELYTESATSPGADSSTVKKDSVSNVTALR